MAWGEPPKHVCLHISKCLGKNLKLQSIWLKKSMFHENFWWLHMPLTKNLLYRFTFEKIPFYEYFEKDPKIYVPDQYRLHELQYGDEGIKLHIHAKQFHKNHKWFVPIKMTTSDRLIRVYGFGMFSYCPCTKIS